MAKQKYYQRPDGLYESIRKINGKRVAFRGHSCREVDRKILEYKESQKKGRTLREVADDWERDIEQKVSEATRLAYKAPAADFLGFLGESKRIKDIKPIDIERYMISCKDRGYKAGTVKMRLTVCKLILRYAVIKGDIDVSPASEILMPRKIQRDKRGALTREQIAAVAKYRGPGHLMGIAFLFTGCRRGELMALRYEDIDRKAKTITIARKVSYVGTPVIEDHTKTEAGMRIIPLLSPLESVLPKDRLGLIFHDGKGGPMGKREILAEWKAFVTGCGLPDKITPHWLRHSFATICFDAGLDPKSTASIMGHADEKITMQIYTHLTKTREQLNAEKLEYYVQKETAAE